MASVEVLIPSCGRSEALARCIRSVARQEYTDLRICIADDASDPPIRKDELPAGPLPVEVIRLEKRGGVIAARQELLRRLRSDVALFLDDDVELESELTVREIVSVLDGRPQVGIAALALDDRVGDRRKLLSPVRKADDVEERYARVGWFYGAAFAIRRTVIEAVGPPTTARFYGHEEIELSYLVAGGGWEIVCLTNARATHYRSEDGVKSRDMMTERFRYAVRNRLALARTYLPFGYRQTHLVFWLLRYLWTAARSGSLGSFASGAWDGLFSAVDSNRKLNAGAITYLSRHGGRLWY